MSQDIIQRPEPAEYAPYFETYVSKVENGDVLAILRAQVEQTAVLLSEIGESGAGFRYQEGKWNVKELVGHLIDTERIMVYRAVSFARGERTTLPGFDEDEYVRQARFSARSLDSLVDELRAVRASTLPFFAGLDAEELMRAGTANNRPYTVRALAFIVGGHERHHVQVLRDRYLPALRSR